jgi:hypothetical protein
MTRSVILAIAAIAVAALTAAPASAKPLKRGYHHHHHTSAAFRAFGAVRAPGYYGGSYRGYGDSPAATGGGSLGYNQSIHYN